MGAERAAGAASANWNLKLLGRPALRPRDGEAVDLPKKAFALAARLILDRAKAQGARAEIGAFLWPESESARQQAGLRTLLKRIRQALRAHANPPFRIDDECVALDLENLECDLIEVAARLRRGSASDIVASMPLVKQDLLEGLDGAASENQEWLARQRSWLHEAFTRAATTVIERGDLDAQPRVREAVALAILHCAPIDARAHSAMLKLQGIRGGSKGLKSTFAFHAGQGTPDFADPRSDDDAFPLADGMVTEGWGRGLEPSEPAKPSSQPPASIPGGPLAARQPTLVVNAARFPCEGAERGASEALAEDLQERLWKSGLIRVVRTAGDGAQGRALSGAGIDHYTVDLMFRGSGPLRVSARLSNGFGAETIWADSMSVAPEKYESVVGRVSDAIQRGIEDHQIAASEGRTDEERSKFVLVAMAEREIARTELTSLRRGRRLLELAMRDGWKAPRALAALGRALRMEWLIVLGQDPTLMPQAQRVARALFEAAPDSALAHRELGATAHFMGDYDVSFAHLTHAREIAPFDSRAECDYACALISDGQTQAGIDILDAGGVLRPGVEGYYHWAAAMGHFLLGEYRTSMSKISRMPEARAAQRLRAVNHAMLDEKDNIAESSAAFLEQYPGMTAQDWLRKAPLRQNRDLQHLAEALNKLLT